MWTVGGIVICTSVTISIVRVLIRVGIVPHGRILEGKRKTFLQSTVTAANSVRTTIRAVAGMATNARATVHICKMGGRITGMLMMTGRSRTTIRHCGVRRLTVPVTVTIRREASVQ